MEHMQGISVILKILRGFRILLCQTTELILKVARSEKKENFLSIEKHQANLTYCV